MSKKKHSGPSVVAPSAPGQERRRGIRNAAVAAAAAAAAITLQVRKERRRAARVPGEERDRVTVKLPRSLIERARDAVFWTAGLTLTALIEDSLTRAIARLERQRGAPFEPRTEDLKAGRPSSR